MSEPTISRSFRSLAPWVKCVFLASRRFGRTGRKNKMNANKAGQRSDAGIASGCAIITERRSDLFSPLLRLSMCFPFVVRATPSACSTRLEIEIPVHRENPHAGWTRGDGLTGLKPDRLRVDGAWDWAKLSSSGERHPVCLLGKAKHPEIMFSDVRICMNGEEGLGRVYQGKLDVALTWRDRIEIEQDGIHVVIVCIERSVGGDIGYEALEITPVFGGHRGADVLNGHSGGCARIPIHHAEVGIGDDPFGQEWIVIL